MTTVCTIGHSTHPIEAFIRILEANGIQRLVDIRTVPRSRHNPQFEQVALRDALVGQGMAYSYCKALGGLRSKVKESVNNGWRNQSFRNYADYMQTAQFVTAVEDLVVLANEAPVAIMCAEAVPWRCHRSLVGDALLVRGIEVVDIMSATNTKPHTLTSFAVVDGTRITYPAPDLPQP